MKTILFLDDWMLDSRRNLERTFVGPTRSPRRVEFAEPDAPVIGGYTNVVRDGRTGLWRMWYTVQGKQAIAGKNFNTFLCYAESDDGFVWRRPDLGYWKQLGFDASLRNAVKFDRYPTVTYKVTLDAFEPDPTRRYKLVAADIEGPITDNKIRGTLYVSPDGLEWAQLPGAQWYDGRMGSDTDNNVFFNPVTGRYQIVCRSSCLDRRVAMVESPDLLNWTDPLVALGPDTLDEPLPQFYSMTPWWYRDHFLGLMQVQRIASTEPSAAKWLGKIHDELIYSYNGVYWNRTNRRPVMPRGRLDEPGRQAIYTNSVVEQEDGQLRFYSVCYTVEHFAAEPPEPVKVDPTLVVHTLRPEGFVCLEPPAGYGQLATRGLIPRNGDLRLNFAAPNGRVWVQVSNAEFKPFDGYTFDDCIPLSGDDVNAPVRWKDGRTLDRFVNDWVRLEFKLFQSQLYAIHWDFRIQYGDCILERI